MRHKLTVITDEHGKVLASQLGHGDAPHPQSGIIGRIVGGPGQAEHRIEFDVPNLQSAADVAAFHEQLARHLGEHRE